MVGFKAQHIRRRFGQQVSGFVQRNQLTLLEQGHPATQGLGLFEVMRGEQDRVALFVEARNKLPEGLAQLDVYTRRRLVEHNHGGAVHQGLRHQHAALHAAR